MNDRRVPAAPLRIRPAPSAWRTLLAAVALALALAGCSLRSDFEPPQLQGRPLMVAESGQPRLWVLSKQEERRRLGMGGRHGSRSGRVATLFHFQVQAFDPATARPLWTRRILTLGDPTPGFNTPIIGSAASGRLLGQDGDLVWLLVDDKPMALAVADATLVADRAAIEQRNPGLAGLMPAEARHYGFDRGLVLMSADARHHIVRGRALRAESYAPPAPVAEVPARKPNGMPVIVPLRPFGEDPARQAMLQGEWLGLYSPKEAQDAANDTRGDHLRYPYSVLNEGALARRGFWRARIVEARSFDERFRRLDALAPIADAPVFLKGRFLRDLASGEPLPAQSPPGLYVWHSTRIDRDGRLALTRLDAGLRPLWRAELPLGESGTANPVTYWQLPGRLLVLGDLPLYRDGVQSRLPHLVSISLDDGRLQAWNLEANAMAQAPALQ